MPNKEEFRSKKPTFKIQLNGLFGTGKTHFGLTFPKVFYIGTEPGGLDLLHVAVNNPLLDNLVEYEYFLPSTHEEVRGMFKEPSGKDEGGAIYKAARRAKELYAKGEVETLFLDNLTYTSEKFWLYINTFQKVISAKTGNVDTQGMYGELARWLFRFISMEIVNFPGNVIVSCHLKRESEEAMEDKIDKSADISPNILGGFRNQSEGMFGASLYLDREITPDGKPKFIAYCQKARAMGSTINAKNRYGLPVKVENVSYQTLMESVKQIKEPAKQVQQ